MQKSVREIIDMIDRGASAATGSRASRRRKKRETAAISDRESITKITKTNGLRCRT